MNLPSSCFLARRPSSGVGACRRTKVRDPLTKTKLAINRTPTQKQISPVRPYIGCCQQKKMRTKRQQRVQRQRWMLFSNGAVHGVQHTNMVLLESVPNRSITHSSVSVMTLSRSFGVLAAVGILILILLAAGGCQQLTTQK